MAAMLILLCSCKNLDSNYTAAVKYSDAQSAAVLDTTVYDFGHTIYFENTPQWEKVEVLYFNSDVSSEIKYREMVPVSESENGNEILEADIDINQYDRVQFSNGYESCSREAPVTRYSSGYTPEGGTREKPILGYFLYDDDPPFVRDYDTVTLPYDNDVGVKDIYIWTPESYDPYDVNTRYNVLYMSDGLGLFQDYTGNWSVPTDIECAMANGCTGTILVGIDDSDFHRDSELTPDLGDTAPGYEIEFGDRTGQVYSDYVVNTVMPYMNENYNTYGDKEHTAFCGSSSGGIECFYIGMENRDKFGYLGCFSPAFMIFDEATWRDYLGSMSFSEDDPQIYMYFGDGDSLERELYYSNSIQPGILLDCGYSPSKLEVKQYPEGIHEALYWRVYFPEFFAYLS